MNGFITFLSKEHIVDM